MYGPLTWISESVRRPTGASLQWRPSGSEGCEILRCAQNDMDASSFCRSMSMRYCLLDLPLHTQCSLRPQRFKNNRLTTENTERTERTENMNCLGQHKRELLVDDILPIFFL
jgi:hypothetical protein